MVNKRYDMPIAETSMPPETFHAVVENDQSQKVLHRLTELSPATPYTTTTLYAGIQPFFPMASAWITGRILAALTGCFAKSPSGREISLY